MPRKTITVLTDDYDGAELPEDTQAVNLSLGRTTYRLFLSDDNHGKLLEALEPFVKDAETVSTSAARASTSSRSANSSDKERNAKVRHWAIDTKYQYTNAAGEKVTLGNRGRIPDVVVKAWEEAGSPEIG